MPLRGIDVVYLHRQGGEPAKGIPGGWGIGGADLVCFGSHATNQPTIQPISPCMVENNLYREDANQR